MKYLAAILSLLVSTAPAFAKDVVVTVPDQITSYDALNVNFDGTVSISKPKVWANGDYLPIEYFTRNTAQNVCVLFGFSETDATVNLGAVTSGVKGAVGLIANADGSIGLGRIFLKSDLTKDTWLVDLVTCHKN